MVRFFAKAWWIMIGMFLGSTALTLFLTVIHKDRFLDQCSLEHDATQGTSECGAMYVAALLGSLIGCLIGVTMIVRFEFFCRALQICTPCISDRITAL